MNFGSLGPLHKLELAVDALHTTMTTKFQNYRQTLFFLFLSDSCLYMVNLDLGPFFLEVAKKGGNIGLFEKETKIGFAEKIELPNDWNEIVFCVFSDFRCHKTRKNMFPVRIVVFLCTYNEVCID